MRFSDNGGHSRERLLATLRHEGVRDERVLAALAAVPRDAFVPPEQRAQSYANVPLPIGGGQTISQPLVVGLMTQALTLVGHEKVLEVGTGSGYQAAVLSRLAGWIVSVERIPALAERARRTLDTLGYRNVEIHVSNGSLGWPAGGPYDAIIVTAAAPRVPQPLVEQLKNDGRLVVPVGSRTAQELVLVTRHGSGVDTRNLGPVRFVPLLGEAGWQGDASEGSDPPP